MPEMARVPNGPEVVGFTAEASVATLLEFAARMPASDLFLWSNWNHCVVAVRHLGIVRILCVMDIDQGRRCISYLKVMAGLDLAEQRRPLDGRWVVQSEDRTLRNLDLRLSTIPTLYGEDVAIRLLDGSAQGLTLDLIGMNATELNEMHSLLSIPSGLILVSGPTGSGKSTTLYAILRYLNNGQRKLNTIEDPIELAISGVRQSQINPKAEVGFPELLRSVLRQSPDVIMIGEIRDAVTAETAVRAANSGHLVLASVHAGSAVGAIQSMVGLGVPTHFLANSIQGVIAQRLVRTLCPECKTHFDLNDSPQTFAEVRPWLLPGEGNHIFAAHGCDSCFQSGYIGRTGVFEILKTGPEFRRLIAEGRPGREMREKASQEGLLQLRRAALLKVAKGLTNVEELLRVIPSEDLGLDD